MPLPPLPEQKRIADKVDALLARVDACRQRLDRVAAILKRFRQSVLASATSGELTREWREERPGIRPWRETAASAHLPNDLERLVKQRFKVVPIEHSAGVLPSTWSVATVGSLYDASVLLDFADGNHGSLYPRNTDFSEPNGPGVRFLTASQLGNFWELELAVCPRLRNDKARQLTKGWARDGDVLLSHNATVGRVALLEGAAEDVLLGTSVTFYRFNPEYVLARFARVVFSSPFFQNQLQSVMEQTTRNQVPITKQVSLHMVCPPLEEQHELVRRVEALLGSADEFVLKRNAAAEFVARLTSSVLEKAFRGELVPQDPNDEPASALLERIHAQSAPTADTSIRKPRSRAEAIPEATHRSAPRKRRAAP